MIKEKEIAGINFAAGMTEWQSLDFGIGVRLHRHWRLDLALGPFFFVIERAYWNGKHRRMDWL